jgi:hypothetical protein
MKRPLSELTEDEFNNLKSMDLLHEVYPESPDSWHALTHSQKHISTVHILKKILASLDIYDIIKLKQKAQEWLEKYDEK